MKLETWNSTIKDMEESDNRCSLLEKRSFYSIFSVMIWISSVKIEIIPKGTVQMGKMNREQVELL